MRILYTSSEGAVFDFSTLKNAPSPRLTRIKTADFHKWEYVPDGVAMQYGVNVARYTRDAARYETQLYIYGTPAERETFLEEFHNAIMHDIAMNTPGTLTWGEWQISAVVIASDTYPHEDLDHVTVNDLTFYCPNPRWVLPETYKFSKGLTVLGNYDSDKGGGHRGNDGFFPFEWGYGILWAAPAVPKTYALDISHHVPSDFRLVINGPASRPRVTIGGNVYGVNYVVPPYKSITIDSKAHTVMLSDGTNLFNYRDFENPVFEKIGYGKLDVLRSEDFSFELTVYKESDEPRWNLLSQT